MTIYQFQEVAVYGEKSGKCPKYGKTLLHILKKEESSNGTI